MSIVKTAVIGVGYLGRFHAQKFAHLANSELVGVVDVDRDRCDEVAVELGTAAFYDYHDLLGKVDAVSIAVPTAMHYDIAKAFLLSNTHVLLEKPITTNLLQADELIVLAKERNLVLQVGHLERFNPVLVALDNVLDTPRFIESTRLAPFKLRGTDINVILDLMIHDIDIIQRIVNSPVVNISASGAPVLSNLIDLANARLEFANGCVANVTASRVSFKAERKLRIFQPSGYLHVDMQDKKLAVFRKGHNEMFPGIPDIISEEQVFDQGDALLDEISAFLDCITNDNPVPVSGEDGKAALATAIEITQIVKGQMHRFMMESQHQHAQSQRETDHATS